VPFEEDSIEYLFKAFHYNDMKFFKGFTRDEVVT
jgi:hypothetical protein